MGELEYYRDFYNTAPIAFYTIDLPSMKFSQANPTCIKLLGCNNLAELKKYYNGNLFDKAEFQKLIDEIDNCGSAVNFESELNLVNGKKINVVVNAKRGQHDKCIEGTFTDVSKLKKLSNEEKQKSLATLTKMGEAIEQRINDSFRLFKKPTPQAQL